MPNGYGWVSERREYAHRFFYQVFVDDVPTGMQVNHHCDNPRCVRPDHLFLGTPQDNSRDAMEKGRLNNFFLPGNLHRRARLTHEQVETIRARETLGERQSWLAVEYGVKRTTISGVVHRYNWRENDKTD
jgi:hypothetical protein